MADVLDPVELLTNAFEADIRKTAEDDDSGDYAASVDGSERVWAECYARLAVQSLDAGGWSIVPKGSGE